MASEQATIAQAITHTAIEATKGAIKGAVSTNE